MNANQSEVPLQGAVIILLDDVVQQQQHSDITNEAVPENEQEPEVITVESDTPTSIRKNNDEDEDHDDSPDKKRFRVSYEDESEMCPICFDVWSNSGEHRLCALRCGHLFGHSCLSRWIKGQKSCPTCKTHVRKNDVRFIYARKIVALDTCELDAIKEQLEDEKCNGNRLKFELAQSKQREELLKVENMRLSIEIKNLKCSLSNSLQANTNPVNSGYKIYKEKSLEISKDGGCRVVDFYKNSNLIAVSATNSNPVFTSFGIRKITTQDFRCTGFISLHTKPIRDLSFHSVREVLLSVSLDGQVKVTDMPNNATIMNVTCSGPIWSCCWDATNSECFYIGEQIGTVSKYDLRNMNERIGFYEIPGDLSPVVSLSSINWCPGGPLPKGGVLVCKLNSLWVFENNDSNQQEDVKRYPLPLEGPFVSMRYDRTSNHLLVSARPNLRHPYSRHYSCVLTRYNDANVVHDLLHTFQGSPVQRLLTRSCQMSVNGDLFVAAHQETNKVVDIWSVSTGAKISSVPAHSPVLDLCPITSNNEHYLSMLSERKLDLIKFES